MVPHSWIIECLDLFGVAENIKSLLVNNMEKSVFLTQIVSRRQKNADAKVVLSISRRQKWNSRRQFSKNCVFPNIQLKGVVNRLPPFKNLSDHTNKFLMG